MSSKHRLCICLQRGIIAEFGLCAKCTKTVAPERYAELLERQREHNRKRRADPEFREWERESQREYDRKRWAEDPEYRERKREYDRKRWAEDPEYRERKLERQRQYRLKKKQAKEQQNEE